LIYREMPAIWDASFRQYFYARWGQESAVVTARTRRVEYPEYRQLLSIKAAIGGSEHYFVDGRRVTVDDDTFLILNANRSYASRIDDRNQVHTFSIFFQKNLAEQVHETLSRPTEVLLDRPPDETGSQVEFDERLRTHDHIVTPALNFMRRSLDAGESDEAWFEEQLRLLLGRMLSAERTHLKTRELIPSARPATRRELHRRLGLATTFIHTFSSEAIGLKDMASAAHLSTFHFLRLFKAVYGMTPSVYLNHKRASAAERLIRQSDWTMIEIAEHVGFGSRASLFRHLKASGKVAPRELRGRALDPC
jgi:AraC family transcriptional regulator